MTVVDWIRETRTQLQEHGLKFTLKHASHTAYLGALRRTSPLFSDGVSYWDYDWDVLLILDACRPDLLANACKTSRYDWLPDSCMIPTVRSPASTSHEWMEAHFDTEYEEEMAEAAYITSNLFIQDYDFELFSVFCQVESELEDGVPFVRPRRLTDRAIDVWRRREDLNVERLIVHYMQPHTPFRSKPEWFTRDEVLTGWGKGFVQLRDNQIGHKEFERAYLDNLRWVLDDVDLLVENCDADIIVSSDHANGLGEWGVYGHPNGIPLNVVREVPWVEVTGQDESTYAPELSDDYLTQQQGVNGDRMSEQLEALGYKS